MHRKDTVLAIGEVVGLKVRMSDSSPSVYITFRIANTSIGSSRSAGTKKEFFDVEYNALLDSCGRNSVFGDMLHFLMCRVLKTDTQDGQLNGINIYYGIREEQKYSFLLNLKVLYINDRFEFPVMRPYDVKEVVCRVLPTDLIVNRVHEDT